MKNLSALFVVILCLCLTTAASAEIGKGSTQLVLTWTALTNQGLSALTTFRSEYSGLGGSPYRGGIALRYFTSSTFAVRPCFWIGYDGPTVSMDMEGVEDGKLSDTEWGLGLYVEKYLTPIQSAAPYVGLGVLYNAGSLKYDGPGMFFGYEGDIAPTWKSSEFHISGIGGFNWFFSKWIGLGGEVEVGYIRFSIDEELPETPKTEYSGNTFGFLGANMFLSIGFGK
jgi:hypothetical protein